MIYNKHNFKGYRLAAMLGIFAVTWVMAMPTNAQPESPSSSSAEETNLANQEARIADRYDRLELLAGRLAELSRSTQPRRARFAT